MKTLGAQASRLPGRTGRPRSHFHRRRHEHKLNTINENPQISPMTQIFSLRLCASALIIFEGAIWIFHGLKNN
jgi:hypothetical protein